MVVPIDDVVHFDAPPTHDATGAVSDADSAPTYDVFEENTDTPILDDQTMTKRTSLTGQYRGSFTASSANGFEAGKWYSVIVTAVMDGVTAKCKAERFRVAPAESVSGVPKVDTSHVSGTAQTARDLGAQLDAAVTTRASQASLDTVDDFLDTEIAAIKAKTDGLPSDPADASDIATAFSGVNTKLDTIDDFLDTEIAAIKAKTDNLPASPAAVGSAMTLTGAYDAAKTAATQTSVDTIDDFLDTEIAAIKAKTDNLPSDPADASDVAGAFSTVNSTLSTIAGYIDTEVAAIKAKTDNLPAAPAAVGDIPTAAANASAVRTNLTTELGRIDVASSTLATAANLALAKTAVDLRASQASVDAYGAKLVAHLRTVLVGLTTAGGTTTTIVLNATTGIDGGVPSSVDDFYNGRVVVFVTGALAGQASSISDYNGATKTLTVVALTSAPASGVEFMIA